MIQKCDITFLKHYYYHLALFYGVSRNKSIIYTYSWDFLNKKCFRTFLSSEAISINRKHHKSWALSSPLLDELGHKTLYKQVT